MLKFWEAMKALEEGKKVRLKHWKPNEFIQSHLGAIIGENGASVGITKYFGDASWEIVKEKRTVQVESWANIYTDGAVYTHHTKEAAEHGKKEHRIACVKLTGSYEVEE